MKEYKANEVIRLEVTTAEACVSINACNKLHLFKPFWDGMTIKELKNVITLEELSNLNSTLVMKADPDILFGYLEIQNSNKIV